MKELTNYTYSDLYDMLSHIDEYKYPEMLEEVRIELESRKKNGEVPTNLVPEINWNDLSIKGKELRIFGIFQIIYSIIGIIGFISSMADLAAESSSGIVLFSPALLLPLLLLGLLLIGGILLLLKNENAGIVSLPAYLIQILSFSFGNISYSFVVGLGFFFNIILEPTFAFSPEFILSPMNLIAQTNASGVLSFGFNPIPIIPIGFLVALLSQKNKH